MAATGKNDIVSDGRKAYWIQNGHSMMQTVTGSRMPALSADCGVCGCESEALHWRR
ncbi:MAG: hydroxyethylthiazole kinase [Blautia faecis]